MTRFTSIHETTRYEVIVRGVESRAEAEAIVRAVEALPAPGAWIATPALPPQVEALMDAASPPDPSDVLKNGEAHEPKEGA